MKVDIEVLGVAETVAAINKVARGVVDFRQLGTWDWVESEFYKVQKEIFDSGGSAGKGGQWAPLSSDYAARKNKKYAGPTRVLIASGDMYREFTSKADTVDKQAQEMTLGFSQPAGYHMGKGPRSKMPLRSSLELTDEQQKRITAPIRKKMEQLIDNAKLRDIRGF